MTQPSNTTIPSILAKIVATKREEVATAKKHKPLDDVKAEALALLASKQAPRRGFAAALLECQQNKAIAIIAEIKKASPSKGVIAKNFEPSNIATIAQQYQSAGATCLSVLTDTQYFMGDNDYLKRAKTACQLPVLRKDFMIDAYQIYESYLLGADCVLLIVACLDKSTLHKLHQVACQLGMDVLIEVHTKEELVTALTLPVSKHNIYGINNRDLNTFTTDLNTSITLKTFIDNDLNEHDQPLIVTESGIHSADDVKLMINNNIYCFLIGEQFMKTDMPGHTLGALLDAVAH